MDGVVEALREARAKRWVVTRHPPESKATYT